MTDSDDVWADIPGLLGYQASTDGRVRSSKQGPWYILTQRPDRAGYLRVQAGGKGRTVHRLVALAFLPNPDGLRCVRHLNGQAGDNRLENLAWGTHKQNKHDQLAHGTFYPTEGALTRAQRDEVRTKRVNGQTYTSLAVEYGVSESAVRQIATGKTWPLDGYIPPPREEKSETHCVNGHPWEVYRRVYTSRPNSAAVPRLHRDHPDQSGMAACNKTKIMLHLEAPVALSSALPSQLCGRCFPAGAR